MAQDSRGQRTQKVLTEVTKESKEFDTVKKQEQKNNSYNRTKAVRRETCTNCICSGSTHEPRGSQLMERTLQGAEN